jgi:hypothetical protein
VGAWAQACPPLGRAPAARSPSPPVAAARAAWAPLDPAPPSNARPSARPQRGYGRGGPEHHRLCRRRHRVHAAAAAGARLLPRGPPPRQPAGHEGRHAGVPGLWNDERGAAVRALRDHQPRRAPGQQVGAWLGWGGVGWGGVGCRVGLGGRGGGMGWAGRLPRRRLWGVKPGWWMGGTRVACSGRGRGPVSAVSRALTRPSPPSPLTPLPPPPALSRDYDAMCQDYYTLQFMDQSVDTRPIAPALQVRGEAGRVARAAAGPAPNARATALRCPGRSTRRPHVQGRGGRRRRRSRALRGPPARAHAANFSPLSRQAFFDNVLEASVAEVGGGATRRPMGPIGRPNPHLSAASGAQHLVCSIQQCICMHQLLPAHASRTARSGAAWEQRRPEEDSQGPPSPRPPAFLAHPPLPLAHPLAPPPSRLGPASSTSRP